jgi:hypothetical protein
MFSYFCLSSWMRFVMKTPLITTTVVMITETHASTIAEYVAQSSAVPRPVFEVSVT